MKNLGKIFEENWKKSIPEDIFFYRFRDSGSSYYGGNQMLRFSSSNIADCMIFTPESGLHLIELKSHKGKSIPLSCILGNEKNKTKKKQIQDLVDANEHSGVYSSIIIFFSDVERCFELPINEFVDFVSKGDRKSIPIEYCEKRGWEIEVTRLKTNHRFNVVKWLKEF